MLVKKSEQIKLKSDVREYPDYTEADVRAIRAVNGGNATPEQQTRAMEFIVNNICCTYDMAFRPGDIHASMVAEGKRIAGLHLVNMLKHAPTKTGENENG